MIVQEIKLTYHGPPLGNQPSWQKMPYGTREANISSVYGLYPLTRLRCLYSAVQRRLPSSCSLRSRSVSFHGVCATDLSQESQRHRNVPVSRRAKVTPCGISEKVLPEFVGGCQPRTRRPHLRRLCSGSIWPGAKTLSQRVSLRETRPDHLCSRRYDGRPLLGCVTLGKIRSPQGGSKALHAAGPPWQHLLFYLDFSRKNARCDRFRLSVDRIGSVLSDRPRIRRFLTFSLMHELLAFFLTRAKRALGVTRHARHWVAKTTVLKSDRIILLAGPKSSRLYLDPLCRIAYYDADTDR
jgi:hypothetical protein